MDVQQLAEHAVADAVVLVEIGLESKSQEGVLESLDIGEGRGTGNSIVRGDIVVQVLLMQRRKLDKPGKKS
ncbi:hypothetical protein EON65_01635 [archaeon]|nr:MAG: hypothetical protein EON65_01635 [archaeon]